MRRSLLLAMTLIFVCADLSFAEMQKKYYRNGKLKLERTILNGKLNGPYNVYWPSGIIKERRFYRDGKLIGNVQHYSSSGQLLEQH